VQQHFGNASGCFFLYFNDRHSGRKLKLKSCSLKKCHAIKKKIKIQGENSLNPLASF
jgi:hypothetical protein